MLHLFCALTLLAMASGQMPSPPKCVATTCVNGFQNGTLKVRHITPVAQAVLLYGVPRSCPRTTTSSTRYPPHTPAPKGCITHAAFALLSPSFDLSPPSLPLRAPARAPSFPYATLPQNTQLTCGGSGETLTNIMVRVYYSARGGATPAQAASMAIDRRSAAVRARRSASRR